MATQATVQLVVDESGAIPGLTRFQQRAMAAFGTASNQAKAAGAQIDAIGTAAARAGDVMAAGFQKANSHALTNLDTVRLMRDDLGVHIPRAMEKLISQSQLFQQVAKVAFGGFAAAGFLELGEQIGSRIWDWGKALMGDTKEAEDFRQKLVEINNQAIMNPTNVAEAQKNLQMLIQSASQFQDAQKKQALTGGPTWKEALTTGIAGPAGSLYNMYNRFKNYNSNDADNASQTKQQAVLDAMTKETNEFNEKDRRAKDANTEAALNGIAKIRAANTAADQALQEQVRNRTLTQQQADVLKADNARKYAIEEQNLNEQINRRIVQMQNEAILAGLEGDARLKAEKLQSIQEVEAEFARGEMSKRQMLAETAAISQKFDNEMIANYRKAMEDAYKALNDAQSVGLSGLDKINADRNARNADIDRMRIPDTAKNIRHQAVNTEADRLAGTYWQENDEREGEQMSREAEQAQRKQEELQRFHDQTLESERQAAEAERRVRNEGMQGWVSDYRAAIAEIDAQRTEQLQKIEDEGQKELAQFKDDANAQQQISADIAQRKLDVERSADAQIAEENRQMAHQITQTLQDAFTNPVSFIKSQMMKMFSEIVAEWIERSKMFQGVFGQTMGSTQSGVTRGSGGILGSLGIGPRPTFGGSPTFIGRPAYSGGGGLGGSNVSASGDVTQPSFDPTSPAFHHFAGGGSPISVDVNGAPATASATVGSPHYASYGGGGGATINVSGGSSVAVPTFPGAPRIASARNTVGSPRYGVSGAGAGGGASTTSGPMASDTAGMGSIDGTDATINVGGSPSVAIPTFPSSPGGTSPNAASSAAGAMKTVGGIAGAGFAGYEMYQDTTADFKSGSLGGTLKGTMNDAMEGAAIGSIVPGIGTAVGAAVGAAVGLASGIAGMVMGEGGNLAARNYYRQSLLPAIEAERNSSDSDYQGAISRVNRIASQGMMYMSQHWGQGAAAWVNANYLKKEQALADSQIEGRAKGGSYAVSMSASQFHSGGDITDFGDLATSPNEGFIHAMLGEAVVNPIAAATHRPAISAMNDGASPDDIAAMYSGGGSGSGGGDTHYHSWSINAMDSKSFDSFLRNGAARSIVKATNQYTTKYAGDGISG